MQLPIVGQKIKFSATSQQGHDHVSRMRSMIDLAQASTRYRSACTTAPVGPCFGTRCDSAAPGHHTATCTRGEKPRTVLCADPPRRPQPWKEALQPR